jgi:DNA-directed RNA polymerase specialized sigma24 family protein
MSMLRHESGTRHSATHAQVRHVLRLLRRPHELASSGIALALCESLDVGDPVEAVVLALHQIFNLRTQTGRRLYDAIRLCDVEGLAAKEVANVMGLSLRQFFRYRREAVEALAVRINGLTPARITLAS